ncbi:MAG: DUF3810 domain-containing protein [Ferruginibacter sp.]
MKVQKKAIIAVFLLITCAVIHIYSGNEMRVENGYASRFSPFLSRFLRYLLGWIPVSIGDILYGILVIWLAWKIGRFLGRIFRKGKVPSRKSYLKGSLYKAFIYCCTIYIIFNIFWGINYDRKGIAWQIGLKMEKYSKEDLEKMNGLLIEKINASKRSLVAAKVDYPSNKELYTKVVDAYQNVSNNYPFLKYQPASIKSSIWGWLGNYTGFTGYYNPFTGEAQLNTTGPKFLHPYVVCHEVAHQLGYAKEMEANFVGYLAASASTDTLFHYSVYLDLFVYANRNLYFVDSTIAKSYRKQLDTAVVADLKEWSEFYRRHESFIEPVFRWIYGIYLQGNSQPQGLLSYDEVTAFIISYYKKFGRI